MREKQLLCFLSQAVWNLFNELRLPKGAKVTLKCVKSEVFMTQVCKRNVQTEGAVFRPFFHVHPVRKEKKEVYFFVFLIIITI